MITIFLSHSGTDTKFVEGVHSRLPDGIAFYYPRSFTNGENLIKAMEDRVGQATVFVFFASKASAQSHWVNFEIARARVRQITAKNFKLFVFPIDRKVTREMLPDWMSEFWIPNAGQTQQDIARYLRNAVAFQELQTSPTGIVYGRGALLDTAIQSITHQTVSTGAAPNVLIFAGINGIGRRTFARNFLPQAFPAAPDLTIGPELSLPQFSDLQDIYRALRQEVEEEFSIIKFESDRQAFLSLPHDKQLAEVIALMEHFFDLGQAVTITTRNGIYEDSGVLKPWATSLFTKLRLIQKAKLIIVADRQVHVNELRDMPNVIQFHVPPLRDKDIQSVIVAMAPVFGEKKPAELKPETLVAIGGHPAIAKMASRLIAQQGVTIFEENPRDLYNVQDNILRVSMDVAGLSNIDSEVLSVLSWLPQLPGRSLTSLFTRRHRITTQEFAEVLSGLILPCYIIPVSESYTISPAIRVYFRRNYGLGASDLRRALYDELKNEWEMVANSAGQRAELFDAFVFMSALEGAKLPAELQPLIIPSVLQALVQETYHAGHEDIDALKRVVAWGSPARNMKMDETVREEILSYVVRAIIRLRDRDREVDELLQMFLQRGFRSYHYIRGFYLKRRGKYADAISSFLVARKIKKYKRAVIGELADCYRILGCYQEILDLIEENPDETEKNTYLLDIHVGLLVAKQDWVAAEAAIRRLKAAGGDEGRAEMRTATIMMHRDGKFHEAAELLTHVLTVASKGRDNICRVRAFAAALSGGSGVETARADVEYLKTRPNGAESVRRIEALILSVEGRHDAALQHLAESNIQSAPDKLLEARILEAKSRDIKVPLSEREECKKKSNIIKAQHRQALWLDFEASI